MSYGAEHFSDGRRTLTWSSAATARLWNAADGQPMGQPMKHEQSRLEVIGAEFSADQRLVLTWSSDGTARLWNAADGQALGHPRAPCIGPVVGLLESRAFLRSHSADQISRVNACISSPVASESNFAKCFGAESPVNVSHWISVTASASTSFANRDLSLPAWMVPSAVRSSSIAAAMAFFLFVFPVDFRTCRRPPVSPSGT